MQVFVMRHGEAEPYAPQDALRHLTSRGEQQVRDTIQRHLQSLEGVDALLASPYIRAQETALIASELLGIPILTTEELTPDMGWQQVGDLLTERDYDKVLLVSHQPLVSHFVNWLCDLPQGQYVMGTSALAFIEAEFIVRGGGELAWMHQAE